MFKNIARTLQAIFLSRAAIAPANLPIPVAEPLSAKELAFTGRGKGGKHTSKRGNAAKLKRASTKRNNIRKFG